ncbi:hypothetical protein D3C71_1506640 [compost metagenome]
MAIGIVFCGSFDSPAATPTISVPWNENPAIIATPISADKPPTKGASPLVQLAKVATPGVIMILPIMKIPMMINTMMARTLTKEKKNSLSPKPLTVSALIPKTTAKKRALQ